MPKSYRGQPFNLGFDPETTKPIDTRQVVDTINDIYNPSTWLNKDGNFYVYPGMFTISKDKGILASYTGKENDADEIQVKENWTIYNANSGQPPVLTQAAFDAIEEKQLTFYCIVNERNRLQKVYFATTLFARKAAEGEATNMAFPLIFPIVFP